MEFNKGIEAGSSISHDSSVESVKLSGTAPVSDRASDLSTPEWPKRTAEEVARVVEGIAKPFAIGLRAAYDFGFMLRAKAQLAAQSAVERIAISQAPPRGYTLSPDERAALREHQYVLSHLRDKQREFIKTEGRQKSFKK